MRHHPRCTLTQWSLLVAHAHDKGKDQRRSPMLVTKTWSG
jgi:hypothetical protein